MPDSVITDGKREAGGCFLSMDNCGSDGKEKPNEHLWSLPPLQGLFPVALIWGRLCYPSATWLSIWNFFPGQMWKQQKHLYQRQNHALMNYTLANFHVWKRVNVHFDWGPGSLHFSGPAHTCHPSHLFRVLSSSFPNKAFITLSGTVVINLGCTLESLGRFKNFWTKLKIN